jgi:myo-inositol 2-dehydrogenase / D-chiro-inositol 1-dehydrogenase
MNTSLENMSRRDFIGKTTLAATALTAGAAFAQAPAIGSGPLKVGLIGCGGRGSGAIKNFIDAAKILGREVEITGLGDVHEPSTHKVAEAHQVDRERCFGGFDAYQKVIASGCDFVLDATPPVFRPMHFAAAVDAGKHTFIEKPVSVDPEGSRSIIATGEIAKAKGLACVTGTQRRHMAGYLRQKAEIEAGAIGEIRGGIIQWNGRVPWVRLRNEGESDGNYMARNWLAFNETCGDHIVEQHVHNIDVACWFLDRLPVTALGFGARMRRETGNVYDFFSVDYDFGDDVHIHSQCRQISGTYGRVGEKFTGATGSLLGGGRTNGKKVEIDEIELDSQNGMIQEHVDLIRSVLDGKPLNHARRIAEVCTVAIAGRIAAYTGAIVRINDLLTREDSPYYNLNLSPKAEDFVNGTVVAPEEGVAPIPGEPMS